MKNTHTTKNKRRSTGLFSARNRLSRRSGTSAQGSALIAVGPKSVFA